MEKGSGLGIVLTVGIVLFLMEYTNFPAQVAAMLNAFTSASNPAPTTTASTTQVINAAGQIDTKMNSANTSSVPITGGSVQ